MYCVPCVLQKQRRLPLKTCIYLYSKTILAFGEAFDLTILWAYLQSVRYVPKYVPKMITRESAL